MLATTQRSRHRYATLPQEGQAEHRKFGHVVLEICERTDRQTGTHSNIPLSYREGANTEQQHE